MSDESVKEMTMHAPYINMKFFKDGGGEFNLDDGVGWRWWGTDDTFLLGLIRVGNSKVYDGWKKLLAEHRDITKNDIKGAIKRSLNKDPKDGLYTLIGDNVAYKDFDCLSDAEYSNRQYDVKECLENNFYEKEIADKVADNIVYEALKNTRSSEEIFEDYEAELTKDFDGQGKSWKEVVEDIIDVCNKHKKAVDFTDCVTDEINEHKEGIREGFYERFTEDYWEHFSLDDEDVKRLAEEHELPEKIISHCGRGGSDTLEEFCPVSESQTFFESYY